MRLGEHFALDDQLQPELRFVSFLFDDPHLGNEFLPRARSTSRPIVRSDRRSGPQQLFTDDVRGPITRQVLYGAHNVQCEGLCSSHQLAARHELSLTIRTPQSEIRNYSLRSLTSSHCSHARRRSSGSRSGPTSSSTASTSSTEAPVLSAPR